MSDANAQKEPTMEEILASIRRIISEDDEPANEQDRKEEASADETSVDDLLAEEPEPELEPEAATESPVEEPEEEPSADVVELTQMLRDDGSVEDLAGEDDLVLEEEPAPAPEPEPEPEQPRRAAMNAYDGLLSDQTAETAASAFAGLAGALSAQRDIAVPTHRTLEDITKELLRPMLKEWLDKNLPTIVQRIVEREISKLTGQVDDQRR